MLITNADEISHRLTDHRRDETGKPQPLGVVWKEQTAWKDGECQELKDDGDRHQSLNRNKPCCKAHERQRFTTRLTNNNLL